MVIELDTVLLSLGISSLTSAGVAYYFRFHQKPKHEKIFEHNRNASLDIIFSQLNFYDRFVEDFFNIMEKQLGPLSEDKKSILPRPKLDDYKGGKVHVIDPMDVELWTKYNNVKEICRPIIENMNKHFQQFLDDNKIYINFIHHEFLMKVKRYYNYTNSYAEWCLRDTLIFDGLKDRLNTAYELIEYTKKQKIKPDEISSVKIFIKNWDDNTKSRLYASGPPEK